MSVTKMLRVGDLIDDALETLYRTGERPRQVTLRPTGGGLDTAGTVVTLDPGSVDLIQVTDVIEFGSELMLVTGKSGDAITEFTVNRGYANTIRGVHPAGSVGLKNPQWGRAQVRRAIARYFTRAGNLWLPKITSGVYRVEGEKLYVKLPKDTMRVLEVTYLHPETGRFVFIDNWTFHSRVPTSVVSTGKALRVPTPVEMEDDLMVTLQGVYSFTGPGTDRDTIRVPVGSDDLPQQYAAAYLLTGRELSRTEVDHVEEWNQEQVIRSGVNIRLMRELWGQFYRSTDEARRLVDTPRYRSFRKIRNL